MQEMATVTETQRVSYRTVPGILRIAPQWPDPQSCCGVLFCVFNNKDKCWEATNGVRSAYDDSLRSAIDEILDDTEDLLGQDARYRPFFCHSIYMVGRKQKKSNPVIFFCCEDAQLRIKARDAVKASAIMRNSPSIRLGHASFPPEFNAPPLFVAQAQAVMYLDDDASNITYAGSRTLPNRRERISLLPSMHLEDGLSKLQQTVRNMGGLSSGDRPPLSSIRTFYSTLIDRGKEEGDDSIGLVYMIQPGSSLCGLPVTVGGVKAHEKVSKIQPNISNALGSNQMTIGGAILIDGRIYGLTAAHGLLNNVKSSRDQSHHVRAVAYDRDSSDSFEASSTDSIDDDKSTKEELFNKSPSSATSAETVNSKGKGVARFQSASTIGRIAFTSLENGSLGLDWALVNIDIRKFESINTFLSHDHKVSYQFSGFVKTAISGSPVFAVTGRQGGPLPGTIFGASVSMRLPGSSKMCELWTVRLNGNIEHGDCGALVVDLPSGNVYGHIVAGNVGTGFAYIVPAVRTQQDIRNRFGSDFTFATTEDYKRILKSENETVIAASGYVSTFGGALGNDWSEGLEFGSRFIGEETTPGAKLEGDRSDSGVYWSLKQESTPLAKAKDSSIGGLHALIQVGDSSAVPVSREESVAKQGEDPERSSLISERRYLAFADRSTRTSEQVDEVSIRSQFSQLAMSTPTPKLQWTSPVGLLPKISALAEKALRVKDVWPNPELSVDLEKPGLANSSGVLTKSRNWELTGPAAIMWETQLRQQVYDFLRRHEDEIFRKESKKPLLSISMRMMGVQPSTASPTILIACSSAAVRRRISKLFKESGILDDYPGVRIATSVRLLQTIV